LQRQPYRRVLKALEGKERAGMPTISKEGALLTFINVFTVIPGKQ
jgi:hypothetical protein